MTSNTVYQLIDAGFRLEMQNGVLTSVRPGSGVCGQTETELVTPGEAFGKLLLTLRTAKGVQEAVLTAKSNPSPALVQNARTLTGSVLLEEEDFPVTAAVTYTLQDQECEMAFTLKNCGEETVTVADLGLPFPCNTNFDWGVSACDKVLGHHYVAGQGSHLLFERCDGKGPMLIVYPTKGTSMEYYNHPQDDARQRNGFSVYLHSDEIRREAVAAGAKPREAATSVTLAPDETASYTLGMMWAQNNEDARRQFVAHDLVNVEVLPGMTVPQDHPLSLMIETKWENPTLTMPDGTVVNPVRQEGNRRWYSIHFDRLGEHDLVLTDARGWHTRLDFFVTEPLQTLLEKRASFIANHQVRDESKWYDGLLAEWNNETGVLLGPDNYDHIKGWRIYEVTCDDPGLSKPAFLSGKLAELPNDDELRAMDRYVERFVWGGLQCTEEEPYPYAIYGIPDWKTLRDSRDPGVKGNLHIWRIYDYPHIFMMYYNLYRVKKAHPDAPLSQTAQTYLIRAYRTAVAMFTVPLELDNWSAFGTGLYNEYAIEGILDALKAEGKTFEHDRLERLWDRKVFMFVQKNADIFGSEYPFDTTGFESTHVLANRALSQAKNESLPSPFNTDIERAKAVSFMENQHAANVSCRGVLEPAYYWYGSDYRGNNVRYTLSYMAQMGGWSILDYALYQAKDPFEFLRLGYGSLMSSWALLNSGTEESNYGYFFPGKEHDGAASGGFEPLYQCKTWLEQPNHGGPWYYSCEIDLGYCGYLHGAATVLADDPLFGMTCMGGDAKEEDGSWTILPKDGVNRRFHYVEADRRLHLTTTCGRFTKITVCPETGRISAELDLQNIACEATVTLEQEGYAMESKTVRQCVGGLTTLIFETTN